MSEGVKRLEGCEDPVRSVDLRFPVSFKLADHRTKRREVDVSRADLEFEVSPGKVDLRVFYRIVDLC